MAPLALALGCAPSEGGFGAGVDGSVEPDTSEPITGSMGETTATPPSTGTGMVDESGGSGASTTAAGPAMLSLSDGPVLDFGPVPAGTTAQRVLTVTNVGGTEATAMAGQPLSDGYGYVGGSFPGGGGDCGTTLPAGSSCTVAVVFSPMDWRAYETTLVITHDDGLEASRPIVGDGQGASNNLLRNPGGENGGNPPANWTSTGAGNWTTGSWVTPAEGTSFIAADNVPEGQDMWLVQVVSLDMFAERVASGTLRVEFAGQARNFGIDDDVYRVQLRIIDPTGALLADWDSGVQTADAWTPVAHDMLIPAGANRVRVRLYCLRTGGTYCDAYYDDLSLRVAYP